MTIAPIGLDTAAAAPAEPEAPTAGLVQQFGKLAADRAYHVREGDPRPQESRK